MELRVLRYFLAVAREETISGAADYLHLSQPTLSRQLMELEEELGKKLLIRGNRKVTLTEEGHFLRKRAQEIVDLADKTTADFNETDEVISGKVYIGGGETDAMRIVVQSIKKLQQKYPHIEYHLFSGNAEDVTERLDKGLLDFGVLIAVTDIQKYEYLPLPAVDTWGVLMRKDNPLAARDTIRPQDLIGIPLICSRQAMSRNELSGWLGDFSDRLNIIATYNLIYNATLMVDEGVGCALCLDKLVNTTSNSHLCFKPFEPKMEAPLTIVWKKYQVFSKAAQVFLQELRDEFGKQENPLL